MRKVVLFAVAVMAVAAVGMAAGVARAEMHKMTMTMTGYIIDTKCAAANNADLATFVTTHTKQCALLPACAASGYNLYSEGKLWKFDKESSVKVHEFLKKPDSTLHVSVEMVHGKGDVITLVSIENAK